MTLTEFLTARLGEREAMAPEVHDALRCGSLDRDGGFEPDRCDCGEPARVLRQVEVGRKIFAGHASAHRAYLQARDDHARNLGLDCSETQLGLDVALDKLIVWERAICICAAAWSDHPDYDPAWSATPPERR